MSSDDQALEKEPQFDAQTFSTPVIQDTFMRML